MRALRHPGRVQSGLRPRARVKFTIGVRRNSPCIGFPWAVRLEKSGGRTRKCMSHTATRKRLTPEATRSAPKSCRRICSCPVTPPVCVRLCGSITRFSGIGGPVWPPVCAVPTVLAGPSRFRRTAVPCGRLKSCRGGGRRLTECPIGPGGDAGWRASWSGGIRFCLAGKRLQGEEIRSSAASFRIPRRKTASVCAVASHLLYSNGVPKKRGSSPWQ